jgi:hypothetical protein
MKYKDSVKDKNKMRESSAYFKNLEKIRRGNVAERRKILKAIDDIEEANRRNKGSPRDDYNLKLLEDELSNNQFELRQIENEMSRIDEMILGAGINSSGGAWSDLFFRRRRNIPGSANIPQPQTQMFNEINIPNFELVRQGDMDITDSTRGRIRAGIGVPAPIGVPVNVIRGRNVVARNLRPEIPEGFSVPYTRTLNTVNNEISVNTRLLAEAEQQREELLRSPGPNNEENARKLNILRSKINNLRGKLRRLTAKQEAGQGNLLVDSSQSFEFPRDYRPPGGFADAGNTPRR